MSEERDIGLGFTVKTFTCDETEPESIGAIVDGPAAPQCKWPFEGRCGGALHFENAPERYLRKVDGSLRPTWKVESREPLTLSPSIVCGCGGQHGHIQGGLYVNAGGVTA